MAMILFTISGVNVEQMMEEVEWSTLLFFAGLFILVGVLEHKGASDCVGFYLTMDNVGLVNSQG
jgi:Na+/H+ antiporter NhaD/arsenite permease-like protein